MQAVNWQVMLVVGLLVMLQVQQSLQLRSSHPMHGVVDKICNVVIYNYVLCWLYSMIKSVVIALILFLVFCGILLYWV